MDSNLLLWNIEKRCRNPRVAPLSSIFHASFTQYFYRELWGGLHQHLGLYEDHGTVALPPQKRVVQVRPADL